MDRTLSVVIACCFKAVTYSCGDRATNGHMGLLITVIERSLARGSQLSYMSTYEGIRTLLSKIMDGSRQQGDTNVVGNAKENAGLVLPLLLSGTIPPTEKLDTETVRMERARALLGYVSCGFPDPKVSAAVELWLNNERSGPVRDILLEAHRALVRQGRSP